jgi:alpha-1,2-mannosyltransferase
MTAWLKKWGGWIVLILLAAAYYRSFGKGVPSITLYTAAGQCILDGAVLLPCQPMFSYQPALAALMVPFVFIPEPLRKLVWYVICVGSLVLTVRLAEAMAGRLYPGATRGRNLAWLRGVSLFFCAKHIPDVLNYEAYEAPALAMITFGIWALTVGREAVGGFWLAVAAAIRATPLIYLPYLLLKRRYLACLTFVAGFLAISFLPDMISALHGGHTGYLQDWVRQVAAPAVAPGSSPNLRFWNAWTGQNFNNQSLRGLVNRLVPGPIYGFSPRMILIALDGAFAMVVAGLLLLSPRDKEYAAIDGAVLLVAMLALSPMTSRYHFVMVLPVVVLVVAAVINDPRMRVFGSVVLATSFMLLTGTSNDLTAWLFGDFPYMYGFMTEGAIVLLAALGMMAGVWRPPGIAGEGRSAHRLVSPAAAAAAG